MDYREFAPPNRLIGLVKAFWTLEGDGPADAWVQHKATPDGCVELIRRTGGRSRWDGEQPEMFVTGLLDRPVSFEVTAECRFAAVRIWPWAWSLLSSHPVDDFRNGWTAHADSLLELLPDFAAFAENLPFDAERAAFGRAILAARTVGEIGAAADIEPRSLQRWFARHVGMPPRRYLQILRFQEAFEKVPEVESLADHAASTGYADQAHMSRAFRSLAGVPAAQARLSANGPFLPGPGEVAGAPSQISKSSIVRFVP